MKKKTKLSIGGIKREWSELDFPYFIFKNSGAASLARKVGFPRYDRIDFQFLITKCIPKQLSQHDYKFLMSPVGQNSHPKWKFG